MIKNTESKITLEEYNYNCNLSLIKRQLNKLFWNDNYNNKKIIICQSRHDTKLVPRWAVKVP